MAIAPMSRSLRGPAGPGERGVGRLRCWPGGVATARSIGDVPAGEHVMACPHVFQIMLPEAGARLVMGSTGLWELMKWEDAAQAAGPGPIKDAAPKLVEAAAQQKHRSSGSDVSALVVDVILEEGEIPRAADGRRGGERGQGAGCKGPGEGSARRLCGLLPGICGGMRKERLGPGPDVWRCRPDESQVVANIDGWMMLKTALEAKLDDSCSSAMELTCLLLADPGLDGGSGNHDVQHVSQPPALEPQLPRRPPSSSRSSACSPRTTSTGSLPSEDQEAPHGRPCPSERSRGGHFVMSNPLCDVDGVWTPPRETDAHVGVRNWARGEPFKPAGGPDAAGAAGRPSLGFLDSASSDQRAAERREAELSQGGLGCPPSDGVRPSPDKDGGEQCTGAGRRPEDEWGRKAPFVTAPSQWKSNALCSREDDVDVMEVFRGEETWEFDNPDHHSGSTTPTFVGSVSMDVLSNLIGSAGPFTWEAE
ncbi:unnamed protein product [Ostreobium quekettii]|uniref:PPM-type phosphatase domain-containing protein n=1 Tax=Ostreobium quekettii TaxID=121088 RepID=A0A8S1J0V1_9CHLO|nr:unnamed protein product [Ostreobium quekettii]